MWWGATEWCVVPFVCGLRSCLLSFTGHVDLLWRSRGSIAVVSGAFHRGAKPSNDMRTNLCRSDRIQRAYVGSGVIGGGICDCICSAASTAHFPRV